MTESPLTDIEVAWHIFDALCHKWKRIWWFFLNYCHLCKWVTVILFWNVTKNLQFTRAAKLAVNFTECIHFLAC